MAIAISDPETLSLSDGTTVTVSKTPGMSTEEWKDTKKMLEESPEEARRWESFTRDFKAVKQWMQTQAINEYYESKLNSGDEAVTSKLMGLDKQPEFAHIFEDVKRGGTQAATQHSYNEPLMTKVSRAVGGIPEEVKDALAKIHASSITLQEACMKGDLKAVEDYIKASKSSGKMDLEAKDSKGITCLGYAVGATAMNGSFGGLGARWLDAEVQLLAVVEEPLYDFFNMQYMVEIGLGTPSQSVEVLVDTGSSDLWVRHEIYKMKQSSTHKLLGGRVQITYGQGTVEGRLISDDMRIGAVNLGSQSFLVPDKETGMQSVVANGVLGMAFDGLSHTGITVLDNLQRANISTFSLFLTGTAVGSFLVLGPPNETWYNSEELVWVPAVTNMWWAFEAALSVNDELLAMGVFLLDSGTSFIGAPPPLFQIMLSRVIPENLLRTCAVQPNGMVLCPCQVIQEAKPLQISVGSTTFAVQPAELFGQMAMPDSSVQCVLQVMQLRANMPFILGDTFLRTVAAIFEPRGGPYGQPRIGLAPLRGPRVFPLPSAWGGGNEAELRRAPSPEQSADWAWTYAAVLFACLGLLLLAAGAWSRRTAAARAKAGESSKVAPDGVQTPYCEF